MILKTKFIAMISVILLVVIGVSTAVVLRMQESRAMESKRRDSAMISMIVHNSIREAMRINDKEHTKRIIADIADNPEVLSLRILSHEGTILISNNQSEVGSRSKSFALREFKAADATAVVDDDSIISYRVIKNEAECLGCHSKAQEVNGIIELNLDISRQRHDIASVRRFLLISSIVAMITVAVMLSALFSRNIIRPLRSLTDTIMKVEKGDWGARVGVQSDDEIGHIGRSFNAMLCEMNSLHDKHVTKERELSKVRSQLESSGRLEELNAQLNFKVRELETANRAVMTLSREVKGKNEELHKMVERLKRINEIGRVLSSIIETDEIVKMIIKTSAEILFAQRGSIHIDKEDRPSLTLRYHRGSGVERLSGLAFDFRDSVSQILASGKPLAIRPETAVDEGALSTASVKAIGVPLRIKGKVVGAMLLEEKIDGGEFSQDELELLSTLSSQAMVAIENAWLYDKLKFNYFSTIQSLINALEASDSYTRGHSERVRLIAIELARYIGLEHREIEALEHASILHDIGKIGIDSVVLHKAGILTADEFNVVKSHPVIAEEILGPIETLSGVRATILQHHERYDGTGYPFGLVGEEITLKARVLSVADAFDAMVTSRPYRGAMPYENAVDELRKNAGTQFDPYIVDAFMSMMDERGRDLLDQAGYTAVSYIG